MPINTNTPSSGLRLLGSTAHAPEPATAPTGSPRRVAASLVDVEATLRALERTCLTATAALLPPARLDVDICARYSAAAAAWRADGAAPPAHERHAEILTCLHDAGATLRAAAECCHRARTLLEDACSGRS
jgi:hypothetical protein